MPANSSEEGEGEDEEKEALCNSEFLRALGLFLRILLVLFFTAGGLVWYLLTRE